VDTNAREHLQKVIENHYRKNGMRDWEECLKEVQKYYSFGTTAVEDIAYLKDKYNKMRELLQKNSSRSTLDQVGGQDLSGEKSPKFKLRLDQVKRERGRLNQSVITTNDSASHRRSIM